MTCSILIIGGCVSFDTRGESRPVVGDCFKAGGRDFLAVQRLSWTRGLVLLRKNASAWRLPSVAVPAPRIVVIRHSLSQRLLFRRSSGLTLRSLIPPKRMTIVALPTHTPATFCHTRRKSVAKSSGLE